MPARFAIPIIDDPSPGNQLSRGYPKETLEETVVKGGYPKADQNAPRAHEQIAGLPVGKKKAQNITDHQITSVVDEEIEKALPHGGIGKPFQYGMLGRLVWILH